MPKLLINKKSLLHNGILVKKYILITALILSNNAWSMDPEKKDTPPVNTNDLKKVVSSLKKVNNKEDGLAILDSINARSGIRTIIANPAAGDTSTSSLFVINPDRKSSKL